MEVFFYGLFMDVDLLKKKGVNPENIRKGYLKDYGIKIGERATLLPSKNELCYGVVMSLTKNEVGKLYSEESVADYIPEQVNIFLKSGATVEATCYNLQESMIRGTNKSYAKSLLALAEKLKFPEEYLLRIRKFINT